MATTLTDKTARQADSLRQPVESSDLSWRILSTLGVSRILIALGLLAAFVSGGESRLFGDARPLLFVSTAVAYLAFALLVQLSLRLRVSGVALQFALQLLVDIVCITLLMHSSGGIGSGLGGLLVVYVGVGGFVLPGQLPSVFAALATFFVLGEQLLSGVADNEPNFPAAGLLSAVVFMMTLAAQSLSRRMQASEALARQRGVDLKNLSELNEYIVQHLRESIIVVDSDDRIRLNNASAARLIGSDMALTAEKLDAVAPSLAEYVRNWREFPELSSRPSLGFQPGDSGIRITAHLAPLDRSRERRGPILVFLEDASLMNERVQQSKLASLGRLSASIAHEIRNPVGAMSHAAQLLGESEGLDDSEKRLTDIIQNNSERVSQIIDNVLQLSRRDSSRPQRLDIGSWLDDFAQEFVRTLELQEGEVEVRGPRRPLNVRMDANHLRQIMWNLCDNAVKYASETGGIHVEIHAGRLEGRDRPFVEVKDRGKGVDAATAEKIFEPFFTARSGGTGLGLYISRELCELNGATLLFLPREGGGSIFRIIFADPDRWSAEGE